MVAVAAACYAIYMFTQPKRRDIDDFDDDFIGDDDDDDFFEDEEDDDDEIELKPSPVVEKTEELLSEAEDDLE